MFTAAEGARPSGPAQRDRRGCSVSRLRQFLVHDRCHRHRRWRLHDDVQLRRGGELATLVGRRGTVPIPGPLAAARPGLRRGGVPYGERQATEASVPNRLRRNRACRGGWTSGAVFVGCREGRLGRRASARLSRVAAGVPGARALRQTRPRSGDGEVLPPGLCRCPETDRPLRQSPAEADHAGARDSARSTPDSLFLVKLLEGQVQIAFAIMLTSDYRARNQSRRTSTPRPLGNVMTLCRPRSLACLGTSTGTVAPLAQRACERPAPRDQRQPPPPVAGSRPGFPGSMRCSGRCPSLDRVAAMLHLRAGLSVSRSGRTEPEAP